MAFKKVVVFTGAGFGKSIGLPVCTDFKNTINTILASAEPNFVNCLSHYLGDNIFDIERFLSSLELFMQSDNSFLKYIMKTHKFAESTVKSQFAGAKNWINIFSDQTNTSVVKLKSELFYLLRNFHRENAYLQYKYVIEEILAHQIDGLSIFTTNYDLTLESSLADLEQSLLGLGVESIDFGYKWRGLNRYVDTTKSWEWNKKTIEYRKIHGSVDWHLEDNGLVHASGRSDRPEDPSKMLLLYPGFKGTPSNEPFQYLHDELFKRLMTCDTVIVVGFAFRDEYITNLFISAMKINPSIGVYCLNPTPIEKHPIDSQIPNLKRRFPDQFFYIENGILPVEDPLGTNIIAINQKDRLKKIVQPRT